MKKITPILLEKYYSNSCTTKEKQLVESWLHSQEAQSPNEDELLTSSWDKITLKTKTHTPKRKSSKGVFNLKFAGIAASIAVFLALGYYSIETLFTATNQATYAAVKVARGHKETLLLPDGSKVIVNAESELRIPNKFTPNQRVVYLKGHAHFEVARDEKRPFFIHTEKSTTQVLGTSFDVIADADRSSTSVVVTSGKVRFSQLGNTANSVDLTVDTKATLAADNSIEVQQVNAKELTAWTKGILSFNNQSFGEIAKTLERWYDIEITISNTKLLESSFTISYDNPTLTEVLEALSFIAQFEYSTDGKNIKIN